MKHIKMYEQVLDEVRDQDDSFGLVKQRIDNKALADYLKEVTKMLKDAGVNIIDTHIGTSLEGSFFTVMSAANRKLRLTFSHSGYSIYITEMNGSPINGPKSETAGALVRKLNSIR